MGRIAQNLTKTFLSEVRKTKQAAKGFTDGLPFDLPTMEELEKELHDPQHVLYVAAQQFSSAFAESVSGLPEFAEYAAIVGKAEDEYRPNGPPISPLTRSFFTTWAFFDVRFGADHESVGSCLVDLLRAMNGPDVMIGTLEKLSASRMGVYEHVGIEGPHVRIRELLSGDEFVCNSTSGYFGQTGELWYVRLCPPVSESFDYHIVLTTPYVLIGSSREDWTAFLNRSLLDAADKQQGLQDLLKYGSDRVNWCEFVFQAYHHHQDDAIFLTGLPDVAGSLPHSPLREALDDAPHSGPPPSSADDNAPSSNVEDRLRCKLSEAQRKIMAELCPDLSPQLKLDEPNQRSVELTRQELDRVLEPARAALSEAKSFRKSTLDKVVKILANATPPQSPEQRTPRRASGQSVFEPAAGGTASARSSRKPRSSTATRQVYQFRVELQGTQPPIWRRIQVEDCTLEVLHLVIQGAMGWDLSHLYEFEVQGVRYTSRSPAGLDWGGDVDLDGADAGSVRISELMPSNHRLQLRYVYDFGDSWEHVVKLEQVLSATPGTRYPLCIDGARACPPEDCGGLYGYFDFVAAITDPRHEQHEEMLDWHGPYNPEAFDVSTATKTMRKLGRLGMS
jgi:pRiA4b ORF-3-like protein